MNIYQIRTVMAALLGSAILSACPSGGGSSAPAGTEPDSPEQSSQATLKFSPFTGEFPLPTNLLFDLDPSTTDFTLDIPSDSPPALAGNQLDGWSTLAPITIDATKAIDPATLAGAVRLFRVCGDPFRFGSPTGVPLGEFIPGVDFSIGIAAANPNKIIVKPLRPFPDKYDATSVAACPAGAQGNLNKGNTYVVVVTNAIKDTDGEDVSASGVYELSKGTECFYRFPTDGATDCPGTDENDPVGITPAGIEAGLGTASDASQQSSENVRRLVNGQEGLAAFIASQGTAPLNPADIILSFSYSPVSIDNPDSLTIPSEGGPVKFPSTWDVVKTAAASAGAGQNITLFETGQTVPGGSGRILVGKVQVPYYLEAPSGSNPTAPLTEAWKADEASSLNGNSSNLTFNNPTPVKTADIDIPILAVVPELANPTSNLPVAILQHGITANRVAVAAVAEALSKAGIASIAIDLPLHGIPPGDDFDFLRADDPNLVPLGLPGERIFDVDYVNNTTGAAGPDGNVDASGTHFINLADLVVSRDNLRQAVSDLLTVKAALPNMVAVNPAVQPPAPTVSFDATKVFYFGHSLGGIVGGTFLAQAPDVLAGSLAMPGGGIAKLLDASAAFGPRITAGLAAAGVNEGTDDFESFLYFAQAAVDVGDPINHASNVSVPVHLIEVVGGGIATSTGPAVVSIPVPSDLVVPNDAFDPQAGIETIPELGVGGTDPLITALGISTIEQRIAGNCNTRPAVAAPVAVQFDTGTHSTVAKPTDTIPTPGGNLDFDFSAEFDEMLTQIAGFFGRVAAGAGNTVPVDAGAACTGGPP